jgi:hypothetical protein
MPESIVRVLRCSSYSFLQAGLSSYSRMKILLGPENRGLEASKYRGYGVYSMNNTGSRRKIL